MVVVVVVLACARLSEQCSEDQIVSVLAHELGHWKLWHIVQNMVIAEATILIQLGVYAIIKDNLDIARAFGFSAEKECPVIIGLILSQVLLTPIGQVISLTTNVISRIFEFQVKETGRRPARDEDRNACALSFEWDDGLVCAAFFPLLFPFFFVQADAFAVQLGKGVDLRDALVVMQKENLSSVNNDKWYSTYHYSHPPLSERLDAIDREIAKKIREKEIKTAQGTKEEANDGKAGSNEKESAPKESTKKSQ